MNRDRNVIKQWKEVMEYEKLAEEMMNDSAIDRYCCPVWVMSVVECRNCLVLLSVRTSILLRRCWIIRVSLWIMEVTKRKVVTKRRLKEVRRRIWILKKMLLYWNDSFIGLFVLTVLSLKCV